MTTIAYKNGQIAYDSLVTYDDEPTGRVFNKRADIRDSSFFVAGNAADIWALVDSWFGNRKNRGYVPDVEAIVTQDGQVFHCKLNADLFITEITDKCFSIGSGREFAQAAMDTGMSAHEAVRVASEKDFHTGGEIHQTLIS